MIAAEEIAAQSELLDDIIVTAQRLVKAEKDKSKITPSFIAEKVQKAANMFTDHASVSIDLDKVVSILIHRNSHWIGSSTSLKDNEGHVDWLTAARKKEWQYWRRSRDFQESKLSEVVVDGLDDATNDILGLLEDPKRADSWDRKGLVVGHVQSGKTSNYIGLICKAADAGYKIIIVLAGLHNNLRSQTQIRTEEGFLGYETTLDRDSGKPIGVAEFGENLKTNSATTRAENGDFTKNIAKNFRGISPEERPWIFVVKKQKTVLTALLTWIQSRVADSIEAEGGRKLVTKLPLLMIDDEADNASVDTGEQLFNEDGSPDEEHSPKTINSLIRQLLHAFTRKAYVGYTATPFANIYIHHKGATAKEGPDLFPKSFIINLAAPSNYVGPTKMFGKMTNEGRKDALPLSRSILDVYDFANDSGWMPPKHNRTHIPTYNGQEVVPPSLRSAIQSFVLACAARELRDQGNEHSSMLIHVTRFVDVQNHVRQQVEEVVRRMRQKVGRRIDADELLKQMHKVWEDDFVATHNYITKASSKEDRPSDLPTWEEILEKLPNVLEDITVKSINGTAKDALDYATPGAALKVIAVGGDKLARGLTLEGLCVSYFVRTTKMYDTLMQMGRWFGYRPGYLDLCRLYTSPDLIKWFGHIADASEELRDEFDFMAKAKLTPEQYGLKVMSHEVLTVTSPLKMRNSEKLSLTYSGTRPQTINFHRDSRIQASNLEATDTLIASLGTNCIVAPKYSRNGDTDSWPAACLWKDVDSKNILTFLNSYTTHPSVSSANTSVLADYISKMNDISQLEKWSVSILAAGQEAVQPYVFTCGIEIKRFPTRKTEDPDPPSVRDPSKFTIGVLTDPKDEGIDLDDDAWRDALARTQAAWKPDPARDRKDPPLTPSGKGIREARGHLGGEVNRGLLLLYPLSPYEKKGDLPDALIVEDWDKPIMAFAIAFPTSDKAISVEYKVNLLYWMQEYGSSE